MRNLKKVLSLALALVMLLGMMVVGAGAATSFKDDADIQNQEAVAVLVGMGIMKGREDNSGITFQPNATLTRAEAAMMIAQMDLGVEAAAALVANGTNTFSDVWSGYWAGGAIDYCVEQGYINGDGNGHFFPGQNVTGVQFASMLLRLLGYDAKIEGLLGDKWAVNAAALARKAGLTTGVVANNVNMTRDGMAQMAFNALTAPTVEYEGMDFTIGDVAINARVKTRTHTGNALNNNNTTYDGEEIKSNITPIRLCEERFPDLKLVRDSLDNFGREFNVWTWKKVNIAGSESKVTPDAEFTKLMSTASSVNSQINSAKGKAGDCELWVNGKLYDDIAVDGSLISKLTQNGRQVQVYLKDNDHTAIKKVVVVDTYVARVNSISKDGTDDRYVTVVPQNSSDKGVQTVTPVLDKDGKATYSTVDLVKTKKTASFAAGDLVTYTAAYNESSKKYDIQDMNLLEIATTAKLEKWQGTNVIADDKGDSNANFTADGTKYEYSVNNAIVDEDGSPLYENGIAAFSAGKSEINIYVDQYDFVIFVSGVETPKNYAAVIGVGKSNQYGSETRGVTLLLPDNTKKEVTAWSDEWTKMVATNGTTVGKFPAKGTEWENLVTDALADVVTYSVGSDGVYTLKLAGVGYKQDKVSFTNGKSEFVIRNRADNSVKQTLYTTSKTIFMIASKDGDTCNYGVYTGYAAAPGLNPDKVNGVAYATNRYYTNQIDVVYIDADDVIGLASYTYFVKPATPAVYTIEGQKYCTLNAVVDGEVTTIDIDAQLLDGKAAGLYAITNIKKDSDTNIIARCDFVANSVAFKATSESTNKGVKGTIGANGQVLGFGLLSGAPVYWAYNDSTKVYTIDKDYKTITASDVKSVPTAEDDLAFAAHDNGNPNKKLTNVFIVEDGAKSSSPDTNKTYSISAVSGLKFSTDGKTWSNTLSDLNADDDVYVDIVNPTYTSVKLDGKDITNGTFKMPAKDLTSANFKLENNNQGSIKVLNGKADLDYELVVIGKDTQGVATLTFPEWVPVGATVEGQLAVFNSTGAIEIAQIDDADTVNSNTQGLKFTKPASGNTATLSFKITGYPVDGVTYKLGESKNAFAADANGGTGKFTASAVKIKVVDGDSKGNEGKVVLDQTTVKTAATGTAVNLKFNVSDDTVQTVTYSITGMAAAADNVTDTKITTPSTNTQIIGATNYAKGDDYVTVTVKNIADLAEKELLSVKFAESGSKKLTDGESKLSDFASYTLPTGATFDGEYVKFTVDAAASTAVKGNTNVKVEVELSDDKNSGTWAAKGIAATQAYGLKITITDGTDDYDLIFKNDAATKPAVTINVKKDTTLSVKSVTVLNAPKLLSVTLVKNAGTDANKLDADDVLELVFDQDLKTVIADDSFAVKTTDGATGFAVKDNPAPAFEGTSKKVIRVEVKAAITAAGKAGLKADVLESVDGIKGATNTFWFFAVPLSTSECLQGATLAVDTAPAANS